MRATKCTGETQQVSSHRSAGKRGSQSQGAENQLVLLRVLCYFVSFLCIFELQPRAAALVTAELKAKPRVLPVERSGSESGFCAVG